MEDGGVDRTVIPRRLAAPVGPNDILSSLLATLFFDFSNLDAPQIKSQTLRHTLLNLVNTTLFEKYVDPVLNSCIYTSLHPCFCLEVEF